MLSAEKELHNNFNYHLNLKTQYSAILYRKPMKCGIHEELLLIFTY